jgi:hypothetical protein
LCVYHKIWVADGLDQKKYCLLSAKIAKDFCGAIALCYLSAHGTGGSSMATITPHKVKGHVYSYRIEEKRVDGKS